MRNSRHINVLTGKRRRGRGERTMKNGKPKRPQGNFLLDPDIIEAIRVEAFRARIPMSELVRGALVEWFKRHGETREARKVAPR